MKDGCAARIISGTSDRSGNRVLQRIYLSSRIGSKALKFIDKARAVHGNKYEYAEVDYVSSITKVIITCPRHGNFAQTPAEHIRGKGCKSCAKRPDYTTESFIQKASVVHKDRYEYSKAVYINSGTKVCITCKIHGDFMQGPTQHCLGQGCASCTKMGYNPRRPSCLYVLKCDEQIKVGITSRDIQERLKEVKRFSGKEFQLIFFIRFQDGFTPPAIESILLKELRDKYETPSCSYNGSTECFIDVNEELLLQKITKICGDYLINKGDSIGDHF